MKRYASKMEDLLSTRQMKMLATIASYINSHKPGGLALS
jgi:hypothetical protein